MTRSELIQRVHQENPGITLQQAEESVSLIFETISGALSKGGRVELRGFGVFETRKRNARVGRNPRTGEQVKVDKKVVPFFKAGKQLAEKLNT